MDSWFQFWYYPLRLIGYLKMYSCLSFYLFFSLCLLTNVTWIHFLLPFLSFLSVSFILLLSESLVVAIHSCGYTLVDSLLKTMELKMIWILQVFVEFLFPRWPIILYSECLVSFHVSYFPHKHSICILYMLTDGLQFKSSTPKRYQFKESMYIQYTPTSMQNFTKWILNHAYRCCHMLLTMQPIIYCRLILVPHSVGSCTLPCFIVLKGKRLKSMGVCRANEGKAQGGKEKNPVNGDIAWGGRENWVN